MAKSNKIVAIIYSDLHLNIWPEFNEDNKRVSNALSVIEYLNYKYSKIPKIFLGDLFHKSDFISNELLSLVLPKLAYFWGNSFDSETYAISGNHDQSKRNTIDNPSPSYIETLSQVFPNLNCLDWTHCNIGNITFHGIPYLTNDLGLLDYIKKIKVKKKTKNVLLLHTTLPTSTDTDGRKVNSNLSENRLLKVIDKFDLVLSGHIHKPEEIIKGFMYNIGAPQQQRATDRKCKMGYWVLYENLKIKFVHLSQYPRFIYYFDENQKNNDGNFWKRKIRREKNPTKKELELDIKASVDPNEISSKYCRSQKIKDKKKIRALEKTLKDVI